MWRTAVCKKLRREDALLPHSASREEAIKSTVGPSVRSRHVAWAKERARRAGPAWTGWRDPGGPRRSFGSERRKGLACPLDDVASMHGLTLYASQVGLGRVCLHSTREQREPCGAGPYAL
eukprot:scaffold1068_cov375-Prasinococcus_capsulatus_cf.AAC.24